MAVCPTCGTRMSRNDETTKLTEYACSYCHSTQIVWKPAHRQTV